MGCLGENGENWVEHVNEWGHWGERGLRVEWVMGSRGMGYEGNEVPEIMRQGENGGLGAQGGFGSVRALIGGLQPAGRSS